MKKKHEAEFKPYDDQPPHYESTLLPSAPVQGSTSGDGYLSPAQQAIPSPASFASTSPPPATPAGRSVVYMIPANLRDQPTQVVCPQCKASVLTQLRYESGMATLVVKLLCFYMGQTEICFKK